MLALLASLFAPPAPVPPALADTPESQMLRMSGEHALVKQYAGSPTELIGPFVPKCWRFPHWSTLNGREMAGMWEFADRSAWSGRWFVSRSQKGYLVVIDLQANNPRVVDQPSLAAVNSLLVTDGLPPLAESDLRTFEEHVAARDSAKAAALAAEESKGRTLLHVGLAAIAVGWLLVIGIALLMRRTGRAA